MGSNHEEIALDFHNQKYAADLVHYSLLKDQLNYTAHPLDAIEKCSCDVERYPIVIQYHRIPVGFFVLHDRGGFPKYSNNENAILLRAYSVDSRYQGKGIAKESLKLLPFFIKNYFPGKDEIVLAVNHNNTHAQMVYKKCGFRDNGGRVMGRKGEQFVFGKMI
ncbi:GNAT family N-acetyltransferase [Lentibacillus sp. Marseille-P4043]|uniref:GNAT family N-acetyltransferase n=1 Tax=Lentibacillus sp. Marseille-P4043 TaxID=2040293 RepID=UPI000D0AE790|nr:GNAT family N-acetyltransferase [Lentibacillus sp. Marseille-P4043]